MGQLGIDPGAFQGNISGFRCFSGLFHLIQAPRAEVGGEGMWHSQDGDKVGIVHRSDSMTLESFSNFWDSGIFLFLT